MGALVGLGVGLGLAALREYLNSTLKTDDDVVQALALPVLAMVPVISTRSNPRERRRHLFALFASTTAVAIAAVSLILWKLHG